MPNTVSNSTRWDPKRIHRKVRVDEILDDGIVTWKTKSFTQPGNEDRYRPMIDFADSGRAVCDCCDFRYRHAKFNPTISDHAHLCKHLRAVVANLRRKAGM